MLVYIFFFLTVQLVAVTGSILIFRPFRHTRTWLCVLFYLMGLNSAYFFLFSPPSVTPHVKFLIEYMLLYPFFIYMLLCLVITPFLILSGTFILLKKPFWSKCLNLLKRQSQSEADRSTVNEQRRKFMKIMTSGIIFPMAGCSIYGAYIGKERQKIDERPLFFHDLPPVLDGFTIVQISDIHAGPFMNSYRLAGFVKIVNHLDPDIAVITGDIINWGNAHIRETVRVLGDIRARKGVYSILGNHDFYCNVAELCRQLEAVGITVLRNCWRRIYRNSVETPIYLLGIDDPQGSWYLNNNFPFLKKALHKVPENSFKVLLSHRPNVFDLAKKKDIQLTLAGHTHGGQIIVPIPGRRGISLARLAYERDYGVYWKNNSCLYVNKGLGVVGPPVRINCPREISKIILRKNIG